VFFSRRVNELDQRRKRSQGQRGRASDRALAALLLALVGACTASDNDAIVGVWKSDAGRTLDSMRATPGIPEERRRALESDYYGHLVLEYGADTVRAHFDNSDYDSGHRPYRVVNADSERVVTSEWNELLGEFEESTAYRDGDCIYALAAEFAFREYYCRID
jgi:hypothetical protein